MGADQIAEIAPGLREALAGGPDTCVTFEVTGDPEKWVQFLDGTVNAAYPRETPPVLEHLLPATSPDLEPRLLGWEARKYATLKIPGADTRFLASWIDRYFVCILDCEAGGYDVDVTIEML
ncbi:MAG TPA: hypothetical protein VFE33_15850 [Thermoanaerobaculia bacterium]|nr:hypothetical protein [Thermoanaerobaculia bacterium]